MVDVAVPAQLQQWTFEKAAVRPDRADSAAASPDLYDTDAVRIPPAASEPPDEADRPESLYQDRYLSSEEDLSPMEDSYDDHVEIFDGDDDSATAKAVPMAGADKAKACDMAVVVSYVSAGRPKIVNMTTVPHPLRERSGRSASLVNLPAAFKANIAKQAPRLSISTSTPSKTLYTPVPGLPPRKSSFAQEMSALRISTSSPSTTDSISSPASSMGSYRRPKSARGTSSHYSQSSCTSFHVSSPAPFKNPSISSASTASPFSPYGHSFLSSDPFAADSTLTATPPIRAAPHKRLRSLSRGLIIAKNAVLPTYKKVEPQEQARIGGGWGVIDDSPTPPYTPITPMTPMTPMTPVSAGPKADIVSPKGKKLVARGAGEREAMIDLPPLTKALEIEKNREDAEKKKAQKERVQQLKTKLVPRGADERAPMLELPPCPDSDMDNAGSRTPMKKIRKRKSMMDFDKLKQLRRDG